MMRRGVIALLLAFLAPQMASGGESGPAVELRIPFSRLPADAQGPVSPEACPPPPPPARDLDKQPFYSDAAQSVLDPAKWQAAWKETAPLRAFANAVSGMSDAYRAEPGRNAGKALCVAKWLDAWAQGGALLGKVNIRGRYDVIWFSQIAAGMAYLKTRDGAAIPPDMRRRIEAWLVDVARRVLETESVLQWRRRFPTNLHSWSAAAAVVAGVAANDRSLAERGFAMARAGLESVTPEGALPAELARKGRAFQYHVWALEPLALAIAFARANGVDLLSVNDRAFARILAFVWRARGDHARIDALAGAEQEDDFDLWPKFTGDLAFAEIAIGMVPAADWEAFVAARRPIVNTRIGGDITALFAQAKTP